MMKRSSTEFLCQVKWDADEDTVILIGKGFLPFQFCTVNLLLLILQVLHCKCWVDTVTFPVTVTQQSPAAVSMDTYQITIAPMVTKVQKHTTWIFCNLHVWGPATETNENVRASFALFIQMYTFTREIVCTPAITVIKCGIWVHLASYDNQ